jgi:hypothetical protein
MKIRPDQELPPGAEVSDRMVNPEDIVECPDDCCATGRHRHLVDGTVQYAYRGFGVTDRGEVVHGPLVMDGPADA